MLSNLKSLFSYKLRATDGEIGGVRDIFFDDKKWEIRYFVADTGNWLLGKRVLISPVSIEGVDWDSRKLLVNLSKDQIEKSPEVHEDRPVTRQMEKDLSVYYAWPAYWEPIVGVTRPVLVSPEAVVESAKKSVDTAEIEPHTDGDPHLQSVKDVSGFHIHAVDGEMGHIVDFIADTDNWFIRYIEVDTRNWWPGKKVLVAPEWVQTVAWEISEVYVDLTRDAIRNAPEYDPDNPIDRDYESRLYEYYRREKYWEMKDEWGDPPPYT